MPTSSSAIRSRSVGPALLTETRFGILRSGCFTILLGQQLLLLPYSFTGVVLDQLLEPSAPRLRTTSDSSVLSLRLRKATLCSMTLTRTTSSMLASRQLSTLEMGQQPSQLPEASSMLPMFSQRPPAAHSR